MSSLRKFLRNLSTSILLLSSSRQVRKRIFTNLYLTLNKLGFKEHVCNIGDIVEKNISVLIQDRIDYTLLALSQKKTSQLLARFSKPTGMEKLNSAIAKNKGVIVFSGHIGPYFLIPGVLALMGYEVTTIKNLDSLLSYMLNRRIRKINKSGRSFALEMVDTYNRWFLLRRLQNDLKKNRIIFMMGDYRGSGRKNDGYVKFLGYIINPAKGIAWLSKKTGAPIVPMTFSYENGNMPHLEILDEIKVDLSLGIDEITQMIYKTVEQMILQAPERWALWVDYHLMLAAGVKKLI